MAANYNYFEGITVRNTNVAFLLGIKNIAGASGFTLKHSRLENVGRGVHDDWSGSKNFYIADNVFIGRHDPDKMMGWTGAHLGEAAGLPRAARLRVRDQGLRPGPRRRAQLHRELARRHRHGDLRQSRRHAESDRRTASRCRSTSTSNDIFNMGDNCIETDGGGRNIRVFRNRCVNTALAGLERAADVRRAGLLLSSNVVYNGPGAAR